MRRKCQPLAFPPLGIRVFRHPGALLRGEHNKEVSMVEIYCDGGSYHNCDTDFDTLKQALMFRTADEFIEFSFQDGARCAIRIGSINGFCESGE